MDIERVFDILDWIGYLFAGIGLIATVYKTIDVWIKLERFTWSDVDKYSMKLIEQINNDKYDPDLIVTIGRGGAIIGSILSGNLRKKTGLDKNIPLLGLDRVYQWENGRRIEVKNEMIDYKPLKDKNVLVVAGDIITGGTMKFYLNEICNVGTKSIKTACLVKGCTTTLTPNYWGKEIPSNFSMPWMYKKHGYARDSRKPPTSSNENHIVNIFRQKFRKTKQKNSNTDAQSTR